MFCCGVGLTMMGSPAQVNDDDNAQNNAVVSNSESISSTNGSMAVVHEQPNKTTHYGHFGLKHECKKRIDVSKFNAPKRLSTFDPIIDIDIDLVPKKVKKDPFSPKPGGPISHENSEPWKPIIVVDR